MLRVLCDRKPVDDEDDGLGAEGVVVASGGTLFDIKKRVSLKGCGRHGIVGEVENEAFATESHRS